MQGCGIRLLQHIRSLQQRHAREHTNQQHKQDFLPMVHHYSDIMSQIRFSPLRQKQTHVTNMWVTSCLHLTAAAGGKHDKCWGYENKHKARLWPGRSWSHFSLNPPSELCLYILQWMVFSLLQLRFCCGATRHRHLTELLTLEKTSSHEDFEQSSANAVFLRWGLTRTLWTLRSS